MCARRSRDTTGWVYVSCDTIENAGKVIPFPMHATMDTRNRNDRRYARRSRTPRGGMARSTYFRTISGLGRYTRSGRIRNSRGPIVTTRRPFENVSRPKRTYRSVLLSRIFPEKFNRRFEETLLEGSEDYGIRLFFSTSDTLLPVTY